MYVYGHMKAPTDDNGRILGLPVSMDMWADAQQALGATFYMRGGLDVNSTHTKLDAAIEPTGMSGFPGVSATFYIEHDGKCAQIASQSRLNPLR